MTSEATVEATASPDLQQGIPGTLGETCTGSFLEN
jgi:hypothetical protein